MQTSSFLTTTNEMARATTCTAHELVDGHIHFVGRYLRNLGVAEDDVEDAVQVVFVTATRKLDRIEPGRERSFLLTVALRVASKRRRALGRRREVLDETLLERIDPGPSPDELAAKHRARAVLDQILDDMPLALRSVFVLFEIEELEVTDIAALLGVPLGTANSRLRRAREDFRVRVRRYQLKNGLLKGELK